MNDEPTGGGEETEQGGVFGKLPASRPGTRSPRRDSATKARAKPARAKAKPTASATKRKPAAAREPVGADQPQAEQGGSLDDLAWAGIAAVAEAATLGVRLANRALGALRDGVDRR